MENMIDCIDKNDCKKSCWYWLNRYWSNWYSTSWLSIKSNSIYISSRRRNWRWNWCCRGCSCCSDAGCRGCGWSIGSCWDGGSCWWCCWGCWCGGWGWDCWFCFWDCGGGGGGGWRCCWLSVCTWCWACCAYTRCCSYAWTSRCSPTGSSINNSSINSNRIGTIINTLYRNRFINRLPTTTIPTPNNPKPKKQTKYNPRNS